MTGRVKGAKGRGADGAKRHRYIFKNIIEGISRPFIRKLARRSGVIQMSALVYNETHAVLKGFARNIF
ncbi:hypothetical protein JG688_00008214 [Phytophthora aleatoria]|uniref:Histone H4 n=1 Tax=Phytophthora aleatoria TaxID=2496075 RepID=A0A8J5INP8_9STRA|nr:hypothetical protein JG688_00008214 [Phytophthora aleatoria]